MVSTAFTLRYLTFAEASELAYFGAKVLHPRALGPCRTAGVPLAILATYLLFQAKYPLERAAEAALRIRSCSSGRASGPLRSSIPAFNCFKAAVVREGSLT